MLNEEQFRKFARRNPHSHVPFYKRPHASRRSFFKLLGTGLAGSFLRGSITEGAEIKGQNVPMKSTARNVVFLMLSGAPSHIDTFDPKIVPGTTPTEFEHTSINGVTWNTGLFPNLSALSDDIAIVRSVRAWAAQHELSQTWLQVGRNPSGVLGDVAPSLGSIVAAEKRQERRSDQVFPTFLALGSDAALGAGYLPAIYEPFKMAPSSGGIANTTHGDGVARFGAKFSLLDELDGRARSASLYGPGMEDFASFYGAARGLMYNPQVDKAFKFTAADAARYGTTSFGNALLTAKQVLEADMGTRYIQVSLGGWDMHQNIYGKTGTSLFTVGKTLDVALSTFLSDLKASGKLNETLVVMLGEFGRTVGPLTSQGGRDHHLQQFAFFAGAGVRGGRALGSTNADGSETAEYGWSEKRDMRVEDIEATIYSALGINWTNVRFDDPFGRGFEYVPFASAGVYKPIHELWD